MRTYLGDTIRVKASLTDFDGSILTPDSQEVALYDPSGTVRDTEVSPTMDGPGVYHADLDIPEEVDLVGKDGNWKVVWKFTKNGEDKFEKLEIIVDKVI